MTEARWLTSDEDRAWRGYRRMRSLLDLQLARDLMSDSGLSEADYDVLSTLSETDGHRLRLRELAAHLLWSTSRVSHHTARMQQRGLVVREETPGDARGSMVVLTGEGLHTIREAAPAHVASVRRHLIDLLTKKELAALDTLSHRVIERLGGAAR
ncbi:MAG TPA: MarR family winged helix-turn-helix transcriptional regulator [Actinophytocola sp.]|uniref:MarR family winged helix-turn-helix transcriptional regulator n=1 Tax=Actinophytocola sp. TaxID=1872138 RepID=UPI002F955E70